MPRGARATSAAGGRSWTQPACGCAGDSFRLALSRAQAKEAGGGGIRPFMKTVYLDEHAEDHGGGGGGGGGGGSQVKTERCALRKRGVRGSRICCSRSASARRPQPVLTTRAHADRAAGRTVRGGRTSQR